MSNPEFQTSCCASRPSLSSGFVQCSESTAMRVQSGCPFIDQQNIGGHAPEASDRHCTGRPDSTWAEARAYLELYHREKKIPERLASRLEAVRHEIECTGTTGRRLTSSPMAPELPGGTAIDASDDCIGKASDCGSCATSRPRRRYSSRAPNIFAWRTTPAKSSRP